MRDYFRASEGKIIGRRQLTLDKAISVCRADEESMRQIQKMNEGEHGNVVHQKENQI